MKVPFVKILNWIPDFQHVHLPNMFSEHEIVSRNAHLIKVAKYSDHIFVSSRDALNDLGAVMPDALNKSSVISFASSVPDSYWSEEYDDTRDIFLSYNLENNFIYFPGQLWRHKNHHFLCEALSVLLKKGIKFQLVCTGATKDYRDPTYFDLLKNHIAELGLANLVKILGVVPYKDVYRLIKFSSFVINPSLFEGWSTTVEECKSVRKPMVLSDIPVHREQYPEAAFFSLGNVNQLADLIEKNISKKITDQKLTDCKESAIKNLANYGSLFQSSVVSIVNNGR